jgi:hypothetical protein
MTTPRIKHHTTASAKKEDFFLKHEKKEGVFSPQTQNGINEGSTLHKEIFCINIHTNRLQVFLTKLGIIFQDIKLAEIQCF